MSGENNSKNLNTNEELTEEKNLTTRLIKDIYEKNNDDNIKIETLLKSADTGGFALVIFICSLFLIIPTPPPIATIMGLLIMFFSLQMIFGMSNLWLPKIITKKSIPRKVLALIIAKSSSFLYKMESFTRRRLVFMESALFEKIIGGIIFLLAFITLSPLLFANLVPGVAIMFISFGLLNKDGLLVIIGIMIGCVSFFVVWAMIIFGKALYFKIINKLLN